MNLTRRSHATHEQEQENTVITPDTQHAQDTADPYLAEAADVTAQAQELRDRVDTEHAEAQQALADTRAEAERLIADATRRTQAARNAVLVADREIAELQSRAAILRSVPATRNRITDTEQRIAALTGEADDLRTQHAALGRRISELADGRTAATAALDTARNEGRVDSVAEHRNRLAGIAEVVAALGAQQQAARTRLTAIGDADAAGIGELPAALRTAAGQRTELEKALDTIDPDRPGARDRAALTRLAHLEQFARSQPQATIASRSTVVNSRPDGTFVANVRRT